MIDFPRPQITICFETLLHRVAHPFSRIWAGMGVLSTLLSHQALSGGSRGLQAAAQPLAAAVSRAYASSGGSDYTVIDHEYDAVVVGAGGA